LLKYLEVLGYLEKSKMNELVFGVLGLNRLIDEYTNPEPPIYQYAIVGQLPVWITDFVSSNS
jgi:hypothetical protein